MLATKSLFLTAVAALSVSAAPAPQSMNETPETANIALYSNTGCYVTAPGPGSLKDGVCYSVPNGVGGLEMYGNFEGGGISVFDSTDCTGEAVQGFSTFYVGCQAGNGKGKTIMYTVS